MNGLERVVRLVILPKRNYVSGFFIITIFPIDKLFNYVLVSLCLDIYYILRVSLTERFFALVLFIFFMIVLIKFESPINGI